MKKDLSTLFEREFPDLLQKGCCIGALGKIEVCFEVLQEVHFGVFFGVSSGKRRVK